MCCLRAVSVGRSATTLRTLTHYHKHKPHLHLVFVRRTYRFTWFHVLLQVLCSNAMLQWFAHNGRWGSKFTRFTATKLTCVVMKRYTQANGMRNIRKSRTGKKNKNKTIEKDEWKQMYVNRLEKKNVCVRAATKRARNSTARSATKQSTTTTRTTTKNCTCNFQPWSWQWLCHFRFIQSARWFPSSFAAFYFMQ